MEYRTVQLCFSKKRDMHYLIFEGAPIHDLENKTMTRRKEMVWENEPEFEELKDALGL